MHNSTSKGKQASTMHTSVPPNQEPSDAHDITLIRCKVNKHQQRRPDPSELLLFSDPLDGTSSDEQSFDEEDMCGSDSDVETISLGFRSNDQVQPIDMQVDGDHIHQSEDMSMDLRNITTMMEALCKAEGIDIFSITGEVDDHSLSPSTQYTTLETSLDSDTPAPIPLRNIVEIVTETKQTRQGLRTTEKEVPFQSSKGKRGQSSRSKAQTHINTKPDGTSGHRSSDDEETIPLRDVQADGDDSTDIIEGREDVPEDVPVQATNIQAQTPMDEWLHDTRSRYLHILLEMEGLTKLPKCLLCSKAMAVKCGDCIGESYLCIACCLHLHKQSPFHQIYHWTGTHFSSISLNSLGFKLCLEHNGDPCPMTVEGIQASQQHLPKMRTRSSLLQHVDEQPVPSAPLPRGQNQPSCNLARDSVGIADALFDLDDTEKRTHRVCTAVSGNPLLTMVHQSGVFDMEVLFCICPNAVSRDEQLLHAGLFPSSRKQIETAFTFSVLDDFLVDNLECKTTVQQYYSKLQHITNRMFPDHVSNLYKQLQQASRQWRDLQNRMQSGLGHQHGNEPFKNQLIRTFIMDGNFSAEHMKCRTTEAETPLSAGMAFMTDPNSYKAHLNTGKEIAQPSTCNTYKAIEQANTRRPHLDVTGIRATACCHGFFIPTSVVDFQKGERQINMDYSLCNALSYNMENIPVALVMYDIMCQYGVHFQERVERSPELSLSTSLELRAGIGLFHIHGHQDSCLPRFSPSYIPGAKQVDGEIIEMLWAPLNNISRSVLDSHMNHSNWKKLVRIVPSLLARWKRLEAGMDLSAETFQALSERFQANTKRWLKAERKAQSKRSGDSSAMDIYDTATAKFPTGAQTQQRLISEESGDSATHGQTSWIPSGIRIQELQLAIKHKLCTHKTELSVDDVQIIENKRSRLQTLINFFENQADTFLVHTTLVDNPLISLLDDYDEFDHTYDDGSSSSPHHSPMAQDGSNMDTGSPEDIPITLPSSFGWKWCVSHNAKSLAVKEAQLRHAQANDAIHQIRLTLGFKSALFRTHVRPANTQQTKTRAWNAIHNVDTTLTEHARIYSMARDAYRNLCNATNTMVELPSLRKEDLCVATLVLGSETTGQCNKQKSWIWGFGKTTEDDGTWMNDCEASFAPTSTYSLLTHIDQLNEFTGSVQRHSLNDGWKNKTADTWRDLMAFASQGSLKGHEAYASHQAYAWDKLSKSSNKVLSPITDTPLKHYIIEGLLLS
ncbi:hypothetical protein V8E53_003594 [Lactarius tabidus]